MRFWANEVNCQQNRVAGSVTRPHGGAWSGLSIIKQLTELMGQINLENQIGRGSILTISLPLLPIPQETDDIT